MRIFADRFLVDEGAGRIVDLATAEPVRLSVEPLPAGPIARARVDTCDRLATLRHPLLLPLVDYGMADGRWFEAHATSAPLHASGTELRRTALHVVRFLRGCGVELTRDVTDRNVRAAVEDTASPWRPIGVRLCATAVMEVLDSVLHGAGACGVTRLTITGEPGSGLRTVRLQAARAARLAGFVVLDRRFTAEPLPMETARHYCAIDWLTGRQDIPGILADAAILGGRRHVWLRFGRERAPAALALTPLTPMELMQMVFTDSELGPSREELQAAALRASGLPGPYLEDLARTGRTARRGILWVHEAAPPYVVCPDRAAISAVVPVGGVARLLRVVDAARALAARGRHAHAERLLRRASTGLRARGAGDAAAGAAQARAEILIGRGRPSAALAVLADARTWTSSPSRIDAILLASGRAMRDLDRLADAEGVCRTVLAGSASGSARDAASVLLAEVLMHREDVPGAVALLTAERTGGDVQAAALASTLAVRTGDLRRAAELATRAVALAVDRAPSAACAAHGAAMRVQAELSDRAGFERHARTALSAVRLTRNPVLRWVVTAEVLRLGQDTGTPMPPRVKRRVLALANVLPPLAARQIRAFLGTPIVTPCAGPDPVERLEQMLALVYEAPGDAHAASAVASEVARSLRACSVSIRGAARQQVAVAGRPWTADATLADVVLNGGAGLLRDGAMPEAAEPIRTGGSTIGCIAARWAAGALPPPQAIHESLRMAAAAVAPVVAALNAPPPDPPAAAYPDDLLGPGPAASRVREMIRRAAQSPYAVLIEGESGSGKELVACAIHARSARRSRPFCAVNCAALTEDLLEAELFGHVRGAFTGAVGERRGLFEEADQGTLFLDEVAELSPRAQAKLLRVLQDGEVRRVGENIPRRIDARVVAATNRPLAAEVERARFRADLRFRLDVIRIALPPLRERPDEVPWLAERIWAEASGRVGTRATLSPELMAALSRYDWPGNVRELQNVLAAVAVHAPRRGRIPASLLPPHVAQLAARASVTFDSARYEFECRFVRAALARAGGRRGAAARQLGISRQGLAKMLKRLGIVEPC